MCGEEPPFPKHDMQSLTSTEKSDLYSIPDVASKVSALVGAVNDGGNVPVALANLARLTDSFGKGMIGSS